MLSEVMEYYGFKKPFDHLGYFETEHHAHLAKELKIAIGQGRLVGSGGSLSIVLAGHPKLKNDLRRPSLEEIGGRATVFSLEGIRTHQREYIEWVLAQASGGSVELTELLSEEAIDLLVSRLATPLQIEQYLTLAFEEAYSIGTKPVTAEVIETVLAVGLDDLEPHLTRNGYNAKVLAELLNVRPAEVRSFLHGQLPPGRTQDLRVKMLKVGIPI